MNRLEDKVRLIISENSKLNAAIDSIGNEEDLSYYGLDSISSIKILVALEDKFDIEFDDEALTFENHNKISNIVDFIIQKKGGNK